MAMWRRIIIFLGLVIAVVGAWWINHEHARNAFCNANSNQIINSSISRGCLNIAAEYFLGFAVLMVGLFIILFGLLMARRARRYNKAERRTDQVPGQRWDHPVMSSYQQVKKPSPDTSQSPPESTSDET
jgi:chloramphenicol 3-O-phosphotransferase